MYLLHLGKRSKRSLTLQSFEHSYRLVVWLSGNALVAINEVTLCQARLILRWVHHLGM